MGCCNSESESNHETYELFIKSILSSIPISNYSFSYCLKQFMGCEKGFRSSRVSITAGTCKNNSQINEYSETKYYQILEILYNMKCPKVPKSPERREKREISRTLSKSKDVIINELVSTMNLTSFPEDSNVSSSLYYIISPDYDSLFDNILVGNPKSSFMLFVLGLTNDSSEGKAEAFMKILNISNLTTNILSFKTVLESYLLLNLNFSLQLFDCVCKLKSQLFYEEIKTEFNVKLNQGSIDKWAEYNVDLKKNRISRAKIFSMMISKELIYIIENTSTLSKQKERNLEFREIGNDSYFKDLKVEIYEKVNLEFDQMHLQLLLDFEPDIFNSAKLVSILKSLSV